MHNEYGWAGSFEGGKGGVKALKTAFPLESRRVYTG